jgi:Cu2+-exporting ATPase
MVDGTTWRIGKPGFALGGNAPPAIQAELARQLERADTVVVLSSEAEGMAVFALRDRPRPGVAELATSLRSKEVAEVVLLSGDQQSSVDRFASGLRFDAAIGDMSPAAKLDWIRSRQDQGARVVMVGDGINDAPTLAAADASISFAHATDLAQVSSDLLVLGQDLTLLPRMRDLARRTRRIIRQNLIWAAGYNFLAVPFAALGFVAPWGAAIGMSLSSLLVVLNAMRLRGGVGGPGRA